MKLLHWEYTKKFQVKGTFDQFPSAVVIFRQVKNYYFIYTMSGIDESLIPSRKEYVQMEYLLNKEFGTLQAYRERRFFRKKL